MKISENNRKTNEIPDSITENDHVSVDMDVSEFDPSGCELESIDEADKKTVGYVERMLRGSYEYRHYIDYLRTELDINSCALMENVNAKDLQITLEMHHYPLTLFEIVQVVMAKRFGTKPENDKVSLFDVMSDVMQEHFSGNIGLVPLTTTAHQMAHSGAVRIPFSKINGNVDAFLLKYRSWMTPELVDKIMAAKGITDEAAKEFNKEKLTRNTVDYDIEYHEEEAPSDDDGKEDNETE